MERLTDIERMRLYNMRAAGPLVEKPEIDQALHKRGLIGNATYYDFDGERLPWRASNITEEGLQLLELEEEYIRCCSMTISAEEWFEREDGEHSNY